MDENGDSVLFLQGRFTVGGVERVTVLLANAFASRGWRVTVAAFKVEQSAMLKQLKPEIEVCELGFPVYTLKNLKRLKDLMCERAVTHVINQWAFPFPVTAMLRMAMPHCARLACVFHTMPNKSRRINETMGLKQKIVTWLVKINSRLVYRYCHAYVVLSDSYKKVFEEFTGIHNAARLYAIPNPYDVIGTVEPAKENIILYVGRLTATEKRVDRVVDVWKRICEDLSDWSLEILGDGPDRKHLEELARGVPRIVFRGFQNPVSWYAKAKILLLTSDFEGFPMTLVEAMASRCVPVVYGSFSTAVEIVKPDAGVVILPPWSAERFSNEVLALAKDSMRTVDMASQARESVRRFDVGGIVDKYIRVLKGS